MYRIHTVQIFQSTLWKCGQNGISHNEILKVHEYHREYPQKARSYSGNPDISPALPKALLSSSADPQALPLPSLKALWLPLPSFPEMSGSFSDLQVDTPLPVLRPHHKDSYPCKVLNCAQS